MRDNACDYVGTFDDDTQSSELNRYVDPLTRKRVPSFWRLLPCFARPQLLYSIASPIPVRRMLLSSSSLSIRSWRWWRDFAFNYQSSSVVSLAFRNGNRQRRWMVCLRRTRWSNCWRTSEELRKCVTQSTLFKVLAPVLSGHQIVVIVLFLLRLTWDVPNFIVRDDETNAIFGDNWTNRRDQSTRITFIASKLNERILAKKCSQANWALRHWKAFIIFGREFSISFFLYEKAQQASPLPFPPLTTVSQSFIP